MKIKNGYKNGYILEEGKTNGERYAVIATGFKSPSNNRKTGEMIQIWIILVDVHPVAGIQSGLDAETICEDCPFASGNGCYVNAGQAPAMIYKAYHNGSYEYLNMKDYNIFEGLMVRFGAYGNPTLLGKAKIKLIVSFAKGHTGYFHNWKSMPKADARFYNQFFMASTETKNSLKLAESLKLRTFHVSPEKPKTHIECVSDSHGIQCVKCQLCQGTSKRAKSVWINPHGSTKKRAIAQANN